MTGITFGPLQELQSSCFVPLEPGLARGWCTHSIQPLHKCLGFEVESHSQAFFRDEICVFFWKDLPYMFQFFAFVPPKGFKENSQDVFCLKKKGQTFVFIKTNLPTWMFSLFFSLPRCRVAEFLPSELPAEGHGCMAQQSTAAGGCGHGSVRGA